MPQDWKVPDDEPHPAAYRFGLFGVVVALVVVFAAVGALIVWAIP